jgi:hypothetical protein
LLMARWWWCQKTCWCVVDEVNDQPVRNPKRRFVGTLDYPSRIPDMHTIHDPMISVSWIHISELITELHHPLQYWTLYLQLVTWPSMILPRRASLQLSSGYQAALMTHVMPTTLQATDWEMFLVRIDVIVTIVLFRVVSFIIWPS